ncbi:hypothetical protein PR048_016249 [Dryococelus australis]|uniref:Uncharacterized protein n=1 Tax=Dryococelus australis TaxID=614101 RepID=A0ABQ9HJI0_9NEOP|nr:hypothetical protein PR048_016249 [Dryococelus australis]
MQLDVFCATNCQSTVWEWLRRHYTTVQGNGVCAMAGQLGISTGYTSIGNHERCPKPKELEVRLQLLQENWTRFNVIQDELGSLVDSADNETERADMEERYCRLQDYLQHKIKETDANESKQHQETTVQVKLPQLSLPQFNGNIQDWVTLKDTFLSLVG